jgi:hypothetical protein
VAEGQATLFVRMAVVVRMTGLGRSTIYRLMAEDKFPPLVPGPLARKRSPRIDQARAARALTRHSASAGPTGPIFHGMNA